MGKDPDIEFRKKFGENVKKTRKEKKLSQRGMAALCHIDNSDIAKIERGEGNITLYTIRILAETLEVPAMRFFDFEE